MTSCSPPFSPNEPSDTEEQERSAEQELRDDSIVDSDDDLDEWADDLEQDLVDAAPKRSTQCAVGRLQQDLIVNITRQAGAAVRLALTSRQFLRGVEVVHSQWLPLLLLTARIQVVQRQRSRHKLQELLGARLGTEVEAAIHTQCGARAVSKDYKVRASAPLLDGCQSLCGCAAGPVPTCRVQLQDDHQQGRARQCGTVHAPQRG